LNRDLLEAAGHPELMDSFYHAQRGALVVRDLPAQKFPWTDFLHCM
jgi:hypothetical protein